MFIQCKIHRDRLLIDYVIPQLPVTATSAVLVQCSVSRVHVKYRRIAAPRPIIQDIDHDSLTMSQGECEYLLMAEEF